jgi:anti-anti-sigma regulatory factor
MPTQMVLNEPVRLGSEVEAHEDEVTSVAHVAMDGCVDRGATTVLTSVYEAAVATDPDVVVLNFTGCHEVASACIALAFEFLGEARANGRRVFAAGLTVRYQHVFKITGLASHVDLYPDVDTALRRAHSLN